MSTKNADGKGLNAGMKSPLNVQKDSRDVGPDISNPPIKIAPDPLGIVPSKG